MIGIEDVHSDDRPMVAVYREQLLGNSETFVAAQAAALHRYSYTFTGLEWIPNSLIRRDSCVVAFDGSFSRFAKGVCRALNWLPPGFISSVKGRSPQLVHAHFGPDGVLAMALSQRIARPLVVTFHGFDASVSDTYLARGSRSQRMFLRKRTQLARSGAVFIAVSNYIRRQLLERGFPDERIVVHYTGVDTAAFRMVAHRAKPPHVVFVARLVEKKGVSDFISVIRSLHSEFPALLVSIVGDGPLRAEAVAAAAADSRITYWGRRTPIEVQAHLAEATVFCVPSRQGRDGDAEGFGMVFAEAQAMGVPVVSYKSGGVPEAVAHGETGLLAPEGDTRALTEHLRTLLSLSTEDWRAFSERAQSRTRALFDLSTQTRHLEEIYDSVRRNAPPSLRGTTA